MSSYAKARERVRSNLTVKVMTDDQMEVRLRRKFRWFLWPRLYFKFATVRTQKSVSICLSYMGDLDLERSMIILKKLCAEKGIDPEMVTMEKRSVHVTEVSTAIYPFLVIRLV